MQAFEGKVAVITGAASGIGRNLAETCIAEGMHVVMTDIEEPVLKAVAAELQATTNNKILPITADVAIEAELQNVLNEAVSNLGGVHLLCNNAGVGGRGNAWTATGKDWEWVLGVNLMSVIVGLRLFVPQMIIQDEPCHIVNTASVAGLMGAAGDALYSVTKHGVVALTENLFRDLRSEGTQIGCSVLCPGFVNTNIIDSARNRPRHLQDDTQDEIPSGEVQEQLAMFREVLKQGMQPSEIANAVFEGIRKDQLYILPHSGFAERIEQRARNITHGINPEVLDAVTLLQPND